MAKFYRSSDEKIFAGVCAGIAHGFDLNVTGLRWALAIISLFSTGVPVLVYLVLWIILNPRPTRDVVDV